MNKKIIFGIITIVLLVSGCVEEKQMYQYEKNHAWNLTLYPDSTYLMNTRGQELVGNYLKEDNTIIIKGALGTAYTLRIDGNKLVDKDNDTWVRV